MTDSHSTPHRNPKRRASVVVLKLVPYDNRETIRTLEMALAMARRGTLRDMAMLFRAGDGKEHVAFTGGYKADTLSAAKAATAMFWRVTQIEFGDPQP